VQHGDPQVHEPEKVPQLYVATGASKWGDPKNFPWTMGFQPDYHTEAVIYAKHILANVKDAKIGVLHQNDDYGRDYLGGFKEGLGKEIGRSSGSSPSRRPIRRSTARSSSSRTPAPTSSSTPPARRPRRRASARRPTSLEAGALPQQRLGLGGGGDEAGRLRERPGHHHRVVPDGRHRQAVGDNEEMKTWTAWMDKNMPGANKADANYIYAYAVSYLMTRR
jgi:branched-chain amino acid transport system substrate-binding protein